ncbi:Putative ribonuclease H protein [Glycine soja]|uniref:Putative ribonuclease H protein n=1 Tax=Glycine soja TaxID=3848 RepID=A0A0B2PI82_GLYSO|nr:Putative ribonuclease H protein [Glycine soja]
MEDVIVWGPSGDEIFTATTAFKWLIAVWQFLHLDHDSNFYVANCVDWIVNNINSVRGILFAVTCWTIWKSRNSLIFQNKRWTTWQIINQVNILSNDVINTLQQPTQPRMGRNVSWDPPTFPFVKLNTDGSSIGNPGDSGYGGIIRDLAGNMLTAFSGECGTTSSLKAKLLAIYYGLRTAWDNGYTHVLCESDSTLALHLI